MSDHEDVTRLLERQAETLPPPPDTDVDDVLRAGRRRRHLRQATYATAAVVVLVVAVGVALPRLWSDDGPEIVDTPPGGWLAAPISALDRPAGPDDELPGPVVDELQIDPQAAATARLVRRLPGHRFYLYADDSPTQPMPSGGPAVCVIVVEGNVLDAHQACGPRRVPSRTHAPVVMMSDVGTVGIAPDGVATTSELAGGGQLPDLPVVNNLFIDPAPFGTVALEGRSEEAFCAVAPRPDSQQVDISVDPAGKFAAMAAVAPSEIAEDVYLLWDYVRFTDARTESPSAAVAAASEQWRDYIRSTCQITIIGARPYPDRDNVVQVRFSGCNPSPDVQVVETDTAVEITLQGEPTGCQPLNHLDVTLDAPVGTRTLTSGATGQPLPSFDPSNP